MLTLFLSNLYTHHNRWDLPICPFPFLPSSFFACSLFSFYFSTKIFHSPCIANLTGAVAIRKIPLGKFAQRMFYSVMLLIFFLKYNVVDFPGYDSIVGYYYIPTYSLLMYGFYAIFSEEDNYEEKSVYGWAMLSLMVGAILWSDVLHLGGTLSNVVNEMIIAWFITPCTVFAVLLADQRLEKGTTSTSATTATTATTKAAVAATDEKNVVLGRIQTWRLRYMVAGAVLTLVAASIMGLLSDGKMCFHSEDMVTSEQKEWCETGRVLMTSVDRHTKVLYGVLQGLASTRGEKNPPGSRVVIPKRKEELQKRTMFFGAKVSTYDQDNPNGEKTWSEYIAGKVSTALFEILRLEWLMPMTDMATEWPDEVKKNRTFFLLFESFS